MGKYIRNKKREIILKSLLKRIKAKEWKQKQKQKNALIIWRRGQIVGSHIYCYHIVHRTMDLAKEYIKNEYLKGNIPYSGAVFIADSLTAAKGRYKRIWYAPLGGLWFTLLLYPEVEPPYIHLYPIVIGIACCEALREIGLKVYIKWVNDLIVGGHKIGGILTETYVSHCKESYLLFGIGINVNNELPSDLDIPATSIKNITGKDWNIDTLFCLTLSKLIWYIGLLHQAEIERNTQNIIQLFTEYSDTIGRIVYYGEDIKKGNPGVLVKVLSLNPYGGLNIKFCQGGYETTVYTGEIKYL